jgi:hypothetical protein
VFGLLGEALDEVILHELVLHLAVSVKDWTTNCTTEEVNMCPELPLPSGEHTYKMTLPIDPNIIDASGGDKCLARGPMLDLPNDWNIAVCEYVKCLVQWSKHWY